MQFVKRALVIVCLASATTAQAQIVSDFNVSADGWTTPGDADATIGHSTTNGNPAGHVFGSPAAIVLGAGTFYVPYNFVAPAKFPGNRSTYANGTLRYDAQQTGSGVATQAAEIILTTNAGVSIYYYPAAPHNPPVSPAWQTYSISLSATGGLWKTTNSSTGTPATQAQIVGVLTDLAVLEIRGLYRNAPATTRIDNVTLMPPITITTQPATTGACLGTIATITTAATNNAAITYRWQRETTPGVFTDIASGGGYSGEATATLSINTTGNFGAGTYRCRIGGFAADDVFTAAATFTINSLPPAPTATGAASCTAASLTLTAAGGTAGQYRWYSVASGGTAVAGQTAATYATPVIATTTTFYVAIHNGTCESARTPVTATIATVPPAPTATGGTSCGPGAVTLTASGAIDGQYRWYTTASGGTAIAGQTNGSFTTGALASTATYYVSVNNGSCEGSRTSVTATIAPVPTPPTVTGSTSCTPGSQTVLAAGGALGQYRWYTVATGGTAIAGQVNDTFTTPAIAATTTYYVAIHNGTCESTRTPVTATINTNCNNQPPAIEAAETSTLIGSKVSLNLPVRISDSDNNVDLASLAVVGSPLSGATASIDAGFNLVVDYTGLKFTGKDIIVVRVCDLANACTQQNIEVEVVGDIRIYNAVSPSKNGKNDIFFIEYIDAFESTRKNTVYIYNRWGDLVWEGTNYDNTKVVFSGRSKNDSDLPSGTYFYKIEFAGGHKQEIGYLDLRR